MEQPARPAAESIPDGDSFSLVHPLEANNGSFFSRKGYIKEREVSKLAKYNFIAGQHEAPIRRAVFPSVALPWPFSSARFFFFL